MIGFKRFSPVLGCFLIAALCACVKVPEYCGNGYELNPETEFCFGNKSYKKCNGGEYNPDAEFCSGNAVYAKCDGMEFNPANHVCDNGQLKSRFTVFFELNGGNPPAISPVTVDSGAFLGSMFPQTPTRTGYAFEGWSDGTQIYIASSPVTKNMTLTANWVEIPSYQVIYDGNGNDRGSAPIDTHSPYFSSSTVTVLGEGALTKNDHTFSGWSTTADGTGPSYTEGNTFTITANTTLYAKWTDATISTFEVTVSSVGIGAIGSGKYEPGKAVTISAGIAEGKIFKNWTTATPGVILADANKAITTFVMPANAVTITAVFEELPKFTVTYNGNDNTGGTAPIDANSPYYSGSTVTVLGCGTLTKTNHAFNGWSTGASGSGQNYVAENTFTISENTTLYAKWTDLSKPTYAVKVSSAGTNASGDGNYEAGATVSISAGTAPAGQRFKSWTSNDGVTFANANNATTTFIMPTKAVNVAANFELITYSVTVSSIGTSYSGSGNYALGATVTIRAGTAPSGQRFKNWTTNEDITFANADNAITTFIMPSNAVTVTAVFEAITYTVTVTGGTGGGNYAEGATVSITATVPDGQRFKNWTTSSGVTLANAYSATTTFTMPSRTVAVTAVFEEIRTYLVTVTGGTGGGNYVEGTTVSITAGATPVGQLFKNWTTTSVGVIFANANNTTTTFTMPGNVVTVTAVFDWPFKTVVIGGKRWMAENLNYDTADGTGSWCYDNADFNCVKYGRLYNWSTAMTACPSGWHLPSRGEWDHLSESVGGRKFPDYGYHDWYDAGKALKSTSGWNNNGNGNDKYGFSAMPGGNKITDFGSAGYIGLWWTATVGSDSHAYYRLMHNDRDYVSENYGSKGPGLSVRCVAND